MDENNNVDLPKSPPRQVDHTSGAQFQPENPVEPIVTPVDTPKAPEPVMPSNAPTAVPAFGGVDYSAPKPESKSKKKLFMGLGAGFSALVLAGAYMIFMFLPNTPENVYRRGFASVGVGLEELAERSVENESQATEFSGNLSIVAPPDFDVSAKFSGISGITGNGKFSLDVEWGKYKPSLDTYYSILEPNYPQVYFKIDGVRTIVDDFLGQPDAFQQLTGGRKVENIWWLLDYEELINNGFITETELQQELSSAEEESAITADDYLALTQALIDAANQYVFTENVDDMVFQRSEDLGKEDFEGVESRKYLVEVNKDNLKKYLKASRDNIVASGVWEKLAPDTNLAEEITDADIDKAVDEIDFSEVKIEAWVGLSNKILRNVRFSPTTDEYGDAYVEISLLLEDDNLDNIPLQMKVVNNTEKDNSLVVINWDTNMVNNSGSFKLKAEIDNSENNTSDFNMDLVFNFKGLAQEPAYEIPNPSSSFVELVTNSINQLQDVLGDSITLPAPDEE